jgi:predicted glycosyltransferase
MKELIMTSKSIIARAGYTSIMELISLGRTALLIPTPGQTEQEYLARSLTEKGWFSSISQKQTDKAVAPASAGPSWPDQLIEQSRFYLEKAIEELLKEEKQHS